MTENAYIQKGDTFTFFIEGTSYVVSPAHINFNNIVEATKKDNWKKIERLVRFEEVGGNLTENKNIKIVGNRVYYKERELPESIAKRWVSMVRNQFSTKPLGYFVENLYSNPSRTSIDELDEFLMANDLPITSDGHFLAFKAIDVDGKGNFWDCRTGKHNNNVGEYLEMARNEVQDNRDVTCSTGFHFCSLYYLTELFRDRKIIMVKINPRDVVSIPSDYKNSKGRCCAYSVVGEYHGEAKKGEVFEDKPLVTSKDIENEYWTEQEINNLHTASMKAVEYDDYMDNVMDAISAVEEKDADDAFDFLLGNQSPRSRVITKDAGFSLDDVLKTLED